MAVSNAIEEAVSVRGRVGPLDELRSMVMAAVPDARPQDFEKAFRRLHLIVP